MTGFRGISTSSEAKSTNGSLRGKLLPCHYSRGPWPVGGCGMYSHPPRYYHPVGTGRRDITQPYFYPRFLPASCVCLRSCPTLSPNDRYVMLEISCRGPRTNAPGLSHLGGCPRSRGETSLTSNCTPEALIKLWALTLPLFGGFPTHWQGNSPLIALNRDRRGAL